MGYDPDDPSRGGRNQQTKTVSKVYDPRLYGYYSYIYQEGNNAYVAISDLTDTAEGILDEETPPDDKRRYYSGGGGGGSSSALEELFRSVLGRPPTAKEINQLSGKSQYTVLAYMTSLPEFNEIKPGYSAVTTPYRNIWDEVIDRDLVLDPGELKMWVDNNWTDAQVRARLKSLPVYTLGREFKNRAFDFNDLWDLYTGDVHGAKLLGADRAKRDWMIMNNLSEAEWKDYIETTDAYKNGSYYRSLKQEVIEVLYDQFGREQVDQLIADNPRYIEDVVWPAVGGQNASPALIADWARKENPDLWLKGPLAASTRENLRNTFIDMMRVAPTKTELDEWALKGVTPAMLAERLRETPEYKTIYKYKPDWMDESTWIATGQAYNAVGRWYFGGAGAVRYITAKDLSALQKKQGLSSDQIPNGIYRDENGQYYTYAGASWDFTTEQIRYWIDHGITPEELHDVYTWTEDAYANLPNMNYLGKAIGKSYSWADAYNMVSGAQGSGKIRAELAQAQLRRAYDTAFFLYNGRMPTVADYSYLEKNFPSPEAYARVMGAKEDAQANFRSVDELLMRVFGQHADLAMLEKVALGAAGSGAYESKIQLATELDRYRWTWKSYYKTEPTPQDYARLAGYAGPQELEKELEVRELIQARGPSFKKVYNRYWVPLGYDPLTDEDVETLVGEYKGWGAIEARMTQAEEHKRRLDDARQMAFTWGAAYSPVSYPEFGGVMLPGMRSIRI